MLKINKIVLLLSVFSWNINCVMAGGNHNPPPHPYYVMSMSYPGASNSGFQANANAFNNAIYNLGQNLPVNNYDEIRATAEAHRQSAEVFTQRTHQLRQLQSQRESEKSSSQGQQTELSQRAQAQQTEFSQRAKNYLNSSLDDKIKHAQQKASQAQARSSLTKSRTSTAPVISSGSSPQPSVIPRQQPNQVAHQTRSANKVKSPDDEDLKHYEPALPGVGTSQGSDPGTGSSSNNHQCFPAGTLVWVSETPDQLKPIESLEPGDKVWSCNLSINQCVMRTIVKTFKTETKQLVSVQGLNQRGMEVTFKTTPNHPFYKENEELPSLAKDLKKGDSLKTSGEDTFSLTQDAEVEELENTTPVFNFQVDAEEGNNNYYIGTPLLCGNALILVHNCGISGVAALANASTIACAASATTCVFGVGASVAEAGLALATGGTAGIAMPALVTGTEAACQAALANCSLASMADTASIFMQGSGSGGERTNDSEGRNANRWGHWTDLEHTTLNGQEYADINNRIFTQHAVEHMAPRGFGSSAGPEIVLGRGVPPSVVEDVITNGRMVEEFFIKGVKRQRWLREGVQIITEQAGRIVVTVMRVGGH